jgi:membrane glycosyltransferase
MLPVIAGMLIAVPFTVLTSRASLGRALRARGWLLTPEETAPPPELAAAAVARPPETPMLEPAPALELCVRVPPLAPLAMASNEPACAGLTTRAA